MKGIMLLQNGFEDTEAFLTHDVLRRAIIEVDTVSLSEDEEVLSQYNVLVYADYMFKDVDYTTYDFLILPGGAAVKRSLLADNRVKEVINHFFDNKKKIFAICAAPALLGNAGVLEGLEFTCFKGNEVYCSNGYFTDEEVVVTDQIITAKSCYYSMDFALAIVEKLGGTAKMEAVKRSLKGE